jgi:serine/threonine-protein kinase
MTDRKDRDAKETAPTVDLALAGTTPSMEPVAPRYPSPNWTIDTLSQLRSQPEGIRTGVDLGEVLGEGGMGIVRTATQRSLGRDVAVKTLRKDRSHGLAVSKLLREALITGSLEHPNIVPVYDLGLDESDAPMMVLKRISGVAWRALLHEPELVRTRFGAADPLEWHLRTLMQVCSAVHFAHRRGIIHRDIKPENVMVGEFGEVYVLDWGISVAKTDDGTHRFPLAEESTDISGTPVYMAPEMFSGEPADERTDVYLLGATLYEIVAGRPPHEGHNFTQIVTNLLDPPRTPEGAPPELAGVWLTAMAHERSARFATAEELRLALQRFLDHRGSNRLAAGAAAALATLERDLAEDEGRGSTTREAAYNVFGECTFGFRQALEEWPENELARRGLRDATMRMIRYEIAHEDPRAARLLVARLDPPDAALEEQVAALERRASASAERILELEKLGRQMDPNAGRRGRAALLGVLGALWVVVPFAVGRFYGATPDYASLFPVPTLMFVVVLAGGFLARRSMMRTTLNRSLVGAAALAFFAQMALHVGSWLASVPPDESQRFILFVWFSIASVMALTVTPQLAFAAAAYLIAYLLSSRWPSLRYDLMGAANAVLYVTVLVTFVGKRVSADPARVSRSPGAPAP